MAGISFMDASASSSSSTSMTIQRYDLSRRDRKEIMLLIDPSVSPIQADNNDDDDDVDDWKVRNENSLQVTHFPRIIGVNVMIS